MSHRSLGRDTDSHLHKTWEYALIWTASHKSTEACVKLDPTESMIHSLHDRHSQQTKYVEPILV